MIKPKLQNLSPHLTMAASSPLSLSFSNLFSFLSPTKQPPPPPPPPQLPVPASLARHNKLVSGHGGNGSGSTSCPPPDLSSVMCPSLAHANTMFFRSAYNVQVVVDDNEPEERLLNRFRREVMKAGVIQECKRRRFFENKQDEKKRKSREAAKRKSRARRGPMMRTPMQNKQDLPATKKEDDDDNWDLPEDTPV